MSGLHDRHRAAAVIAFLAILLTPLPLRAGGQRLLGTPTERLVGHWVSTDGSGHSIHRYYGPVGANGRGTYILISLNGERHNNEYRIIKQNEKKDELTIEHLYATGQKQKALFVMYKNGKFMIQTDASGSLLMPLTYVDDKVEPGSA